MRADMHKVIVEEPRGGRGRGGHNATVRKDRCRRRMLDADALDALPQRGPIEPRDGATRWFGEHLGPLRRFLMSRVGRPWDSVYSEIRQNLHATSTVHMHILQHLFQYVHMRVVVVGREVYDADPKYAWQGEPRALWDNHRTFYVHPKTGELCRPKRRETPWRRALGREGVDGFDVRRLADGRHVVAQNGGWFELELDRLEPGATAWDHVLRETADAHNATRRRRLFGDDRAYACAKHQLSRKAMRDAGLS